MFLPTHPPLSPLFWSIFRALPKCLHLVLAETSTHFFQVLIVFSSHLLLPSRHRVRAPPLECFFLHIFVSTIFSSLSGVNSTYKVTVAHLVKYTLYWSTLKMLKLNCSVFTVKGDRNFVLVFLMSRYFVWLLALTYSVSAMIKCTAVLLTLEK